MARTTSGSRSGIQRTKTIPPGNIPTSRSGGATPAPNARSKPSNLPSSNHPKSPPGSVGANNPPKNAASKPKNAANKTVIKTGWTPSRATNLIKRKHLKAVDLRGVEMANFARNQNRQSPLITQEQLQRLIGRFHATAQEGEIELFRAWGAALSETNTLISVMHNHQLRIALLGAQGNAPLESIIYINGILDEKEKDRAGVKRLINHHEEAAIERATHLVGASDSWDIIWTTLALCHGIAEALKTDEFTAWPNSIARTAVQNWRDTAVLWTRVFQVRPEVKSGLKSKHDSEHAPTLDPVSNGGRIDMERSETTFPAWPPTPKAANLPLINQRMERIFSIHDASWHPIDAALQNSLYHSIVDELTERSEESDGATTDVGNRSQSHEQASFNFL